MEAPECKEVNSVEGVLALAKRMAGDDKESVNGEGGVLRPPLAVGLPFVGMKFACAASMKPSNRQVRSY